MSVQQFQDAIEDLASNQIDTAGKQLAFQFLVDMSPYPQNSQILISYGILEALFPFLTLESDVCTMYACHILANLAIFENNQIIIGQQPIYDKLVNILEKSRNAYLLEKALMLLTNISCAESNYEEFANNNIIEAVTNILEFSNEEISHRATLLIQNILHLPSTKEYFTEKQGMKILCKMIQRLNSERIILSTAVIISILSFDDTKKLIDNGILPILLLQLKSTNPEIHQLALRTITNISAEADSRGSLFSSGIGPMIIEFLEASDDPEVVEHSVMTLSNLSVNEQYAKQIVDIGGIPFILSILSSSTIDDILMRTAKLIAMLALYELPRCMLQEAIPILQSKSSHSSNSNFVNFSKLAIKRLSNSVSSNQLPIPSQQSPVVDTKEKVVLDKEKLSKDHVRRVRIINEIVETEKTYVFQLLSIIQLYIKPLQAMADSGKPLLSENAIREIFSTVELLFKMHAQFLSKLEKLIQLKNYNNNNNNSNSNINNISQENNNSNNSTPNSEFEDEVNVGDVFLGLVDCLRMYRNYISNYDKSIDALSLSLENQKFKAFVEAQQSMDSSGSPLSAMLITPIQRIPRYSLLLQDLIRHMPEDHPDYQNVNNALQGVLAVAAYLNQERGKTEAVNKVINIQEQFVNLPLKLVEPHRTFIKEGDIIREDVKSKNLKYHRFFLFTDILVEARQHGEKLRHKNLFKLEFTKIISLPDAKSFRIITQDDGFTYTADSPDDKENWIQVIGTAITDFKRISMQRRVASIQLIKNSSQIQLQTVPSQSSLTQQPPSQ